MDLGLKGKRVLVMGASAGLGRGTAEVFIKEGARVAICSRTQEKLEKTAKDIGAELAIPMDLNSPGAGKDLCEKVIEKMGGIDVLVVNTGGPPKGTIESITSEQWQDGFQALWLCATEAMKACLPKMKENNWGRVIFITSIAAKEPLPLLTISNGLRAGLLGLCRSASHELAEFGITLNCVLPGYTETERLRDLGVDLQQIAEKIPAKRLGTTKEFGSLIAFLSSQPAAYITGQAISADGGFMRGI